MNMNLLWLLGSAGLGLVLGHMAGRSLWAKGRRWSVGGPESTGALHNQDMWYWINWHKRQRAQQGLAEPQAASQQGPIQQPALLPSQSQIQQSPIAAEQIAATQSLRAQQMQQPGLAAQQQQAAMQAQRNVPHYMF